jgi:hypothetical protein
MARYPSIFSGGASNDAMVFWNSGAIPTGFFFQSLVTGVYFDSIRLDNPEPFWEDRSPIINATELLSGKVSVQSSPLDYERPLRVAFKCHTDTHYNIDQLREKIGGMYSLIIDEDTYENCYIASFKEFEWFSGKYEFEISFVQDTAS